MCGGGGGGGRGRRGGGGTRPELQVTPRKFTAKANKRRAERQGDGLFVRDWGAFSPVAVLLTEAKLCPSCE